MMIQPPPSSATPMRMSATSSRDVPCIDPLCRDHVGEQLLHAGAGVRPEDGEVLVAGVEAEVLADEVHLWVAVREGRFDERVPRYVRNRG